MMFDNVIEMDSMFSGATSFNSYVSMRLPNVISLISPGLID
jgi:hypothetical protein